MTLQICAKVKEYRNPKQIAIAEMQLVETARMWDIVDLC
jgi:hypothetical protein